MMKRQILLVLSVFVASSAASAACPVLMGTFDQCTVAVGSAPATTEDAPLKVFVTTTQDMKSVPIYKIVTTGYSEDRSLVDDVIELTADGVSREEKEFDPSTGMTFLTTTTTACTADNAVESVLKLSDASNSAVVLGQAKVRAFSRYSAFFLEIINVNPLGQTEKQLLTCQLAP